MNRTIPLPLTGGVPQPLTELSQCIISAECEWSVVLPRTEGTRGI